MRVWPWELYLAPGPFLTGFLTLPPHYYEVSSFPLPCRLSRCSALPQAYSNGHGWSWTETSGTEVKIKASSSKLNYISYSATIMESQLIQTHHSMISCQKCKTLSNNEETFKFKLRNSAKAPPCTVQKQQCHEIQRTSSKLKETDEKWGPHAYKVLFQMRY